MDEHVYKIIELAGSSTDSIEDAVQNAIGRASQSLKNLRWFEISETRGQIEDGKVSVRNVRRDGLETLRKMEKDKSISQDENRRAQDQLQKTTDGHTKQIDETGSAKEAEILQV